MNWRRGCFRIWILATAFFIIAVATITSNEIKIKLDSLDGLAARPAYPWTMLLNGIGIAVTVPLIALIVGAAIAWTFSGFKASTAPTGRFAAPDAARGRPGPQAAPSRATRGYAA